jgi:Pvc16 N-terminal domain
MSNFLAVATVTAALSQVLLDAVKVDVPGADVMTVRPNGSVSGTKVNVYLYQVMPSAALSNADLPSRRADGQLIQRPVAALDLNYLLTFFGADAQLEPQRLLGSAVRALHSRPVLTRDRIRQTIGAALFSFLAESNLADAVELVKFTPLALSLEELSKLWSIYFQTPYSLSIAYQATVVMIESEESTHAALPVAARNIYVAPFRQPLIEEVRSAAGTDQPITAASAIVVTGKRLRGAITQVSVGEVDATPQITSVTDDEIGLTLPAGLHAGVQGLQVIQPSLMGSPATTHRGVQSNLAAFVLHPIIKKKPGDIPDITVPAPAVATDGTRSADVTIKVDPAVTKSQHATMFMNELNPPGNRAARAYSFDSAPHNKAADPAETDTLVFPLAAVRAGDYLVRIQIDGAESPLEQAADPNNPAYVAPKMTIP